MAVQYSGIVGTLPNVARRHPASIAHSLCRAHETRLEIDFGSFDPNLLSLAIDWLIDRGMLDVAAFGAPRAAVAHPQTRYLGTMAAALAGLPAACDDARFAAFRDDQAQEVQIAPRAGANLVLIGFCGRLGKLGMSLNLIHRWFGQLGVHVIYLRDGAEANYDQGIRSLGANLADTLQALRGVIADLGAKHVVCCGNSVGGYAALRYALELQADAVLSFAGPTNLSPGFGNFASRTQRSIAPGLDLRPLYERAGRAPWAHLVYAEQNALDRAQAENFAGLPTVSFSVVQADRGHDVFRPILLEGRYERLIQWLVDPNRGTRAP